ncbi:MAG TPA: glycosyltransferase family 4 protein [Chitinophagaceae bacterium]|mgnify:CR=1 FL=1|nr:glycosyltransferase family 4 protein [Chitinophagaceae bacterium]
MFEKKHVLIIVENLPLPFDRRVWQEANTLAENGAKVSIICPKMKGYTKSYEKINGIDIYRHPLPVEANGFMGYIAEYFLAFFWEFILSWKIFFKKRFHVIQGCNPPDTIFFVAFFFKIFGVKYVFDHHDISPELYIAKYNKKGFFYRMLLLMERLTFITANFSIATNESYKEIAIRRGKMPEGKVQVVRSGPKLDRLKLTKGNEKYKKGRRFLVGYVGVIGAQEGLDLLLDSVKYIISKRTDVQFAIVGGGTDLEQIKKMSTELELNDYVDFYGRVEDATLVDVLNTSDVCVNPDRPTIMNDLSTMNKIMEYMALRKPIVQYDLKEGRFSAQHASLYADNTNTTDFAEKIIWLLDHPEQRKEMGEFGYNRVVNELSWEYESKKLVNFYKRVLKIKD